MSVMHWPFCPAFISCCYQHVFYFVQINMDGWTFWTQFILSRWTQYEPVAMDGLRMRLHSVTLSVCEVDINSEVPWWEKCIIDVWNIAWMTLTYLANKISFDPHRSIVSKVWDTVGNQLLYRFVSARPNEKVMMAALTRSYEKTVQFWVGHRTAAVSMKQTSAAGCGGWLFQHVGLDMTKLRGP